MDGSRGHEDGVLWIIGATRKTSGKKSHKAGGGHCPRDNRGDATGVAFNKKWEKNMETGDMGDV